MLPTQAAWGGLLDSFSATLCRDFGPSLAVALAQLSISMAHPLFPGHDDSGKEPFCNHCQGLPCGTRQFLTLWKKTSCCPAFL